MASREKNVWRFRIAGIKDAPVRLKWDNTTLGANTPQLYLLDLEGNRLIDMRGVGSYFARGGGRYEIYYGQNIHDEILPEEVNVSAPYPNPIYTHTPCEVHSPVALKGQSHSYNINIELINLQGQMVNQVSYYHLAPGFHELDWIAKDRNNTPLSPGLYFVRIRVNGGTQYYDFVKRLMIQP